MNLEIHNIVNVINAMNCALKHGENDRFCVIYFTTIKCKLKEDTHTNLTKPYQFHKVKG